jgi:hypothetical protein
MMTTPVGIVSRRPLNKKNENGADPAATKQKSQLESRLF